MLSFLTITLRFKINPYQSQADTPAKELSVHTQSLWDQYLTTQLHLMEVISTSVVLSSCLAFDIRAGSLISGISGVPSIFQPRSYYNIAYRYFVNTFFEDKSRSGKYHMDGIILRSCCVGMLAKYPLSH